MSYVVCRGDVITPTQQTPIMKQSGAKLNPVMCDAENLMYVIMWIMFWGYVLFYNVRN